MSCPNGLLPTGSRRRYPEPIAVIGMSCRFPSANNLSEFWEVLEKGKDAVGKAPAHRWKTEQCQFHPPGADQVEAGFLSIPIDEFDAKFFEVSPKEAASMDPQHRLLMEVVWESFENAGINPQKLNGTRGGVFIGSWANQYNDILLLNSNDAGGFFQNYKGTCVGVGASRISQLLGWTGPCTGIESDCSAGLTSVSMACKSLQNSDCGIALACGVNLLVSPFTVDLLPAVLSPDFRCKTFDESANGFARGEGVASVVLKRLSDAVRDKDRIWGVIRGTAVSQEGTSPSMGTPTVACQVEAISEALKDGGVDPAQVSYVEAHGTGTPVGDFVEMSGISKVYCEGVERKEKLIIGSVKTNVGHTESCSGIAGLIKVLLCMKNEAIPPHVNFKKLNPKINLEEMKARLPLELLPWLKSDQPRMAGISSFGLAGKNCHVVVEEPPQSILQNETDFVRPFHILKLTAKTAPALDALLDKYADFFENSLESEDKVCFADLASTANVGKADFNYRAALIAEDHLSALKIIKSGSFDRSEGTQNSKICFLFTGQGSQYQGMAQELYETSPVFKTHFDFCNNFLQSNYNFSVKEIIFGKDEAEVNRTLYSQTGIFVVEYALMKLWLSWGVKPSFVLGHSLGEFCAAVCAGILDIEDALKLVGHRSLLIDQLPSGKMLVVKGNKERVEELQAEFFSNNKTAPLDYAAFNAEDQTVVAGCPETVLAFQDFLKNRKGVKCTLLLSRHAFHSKDMDPILEEYRKTANKIEYKDPTDITFISGMLGKAMMSSEVDVDYWVKHTRDPVNFLEACQALGKEQDEENYIICLELGPQPVLSSFVMMNGTGNKPTPLCLASLRKNADDWKTIFTSLGKLFTSGVEINWAGVDEGYSREKVGHLLPTYPFQRTKFWPKIPSHLRNPKRSHPLLGSRLSLPPSTIVFQSQIPNSPQQLEYLLEHKLGERVVFPGAGYIEMMLAAGAAHFYGGIEKNLGNLQPIQLKNIKMLTPLELNEDFKEDRPTCHTILQKQEGNGALQGSIYHEVSQEGKIEASDWILHSSATIHPEFETGSGFSDEEEIGNLLSSCSDENKNLELISKIKSSLKEESLLNTLYKPYSTVGLNFGEVFITLRRVWKCWESHAFLAELTVPNNSEPDEDNFLLHPILIDAMIQAVGFPHFDKEIASGKKPTLLIPLGCKQFIWMKPLRTKNCFIYSPNMDTETALLLDGDGGVVALLYKVDMVATTVDGVNAVLDTQQNSLPGFYDIFWDEIDAGTRFDFKTAPDGVSFASLAASKQNGTSDEMQARKDEMNRLVFLYVARALLKLGWTPHQDAKFEEGQLCKSLGIVDEHQKLFCHFLSILEEEGLLEKIGSNEANRVMDFFPKFTYKTTNKPFPTLECVDYEINELISKNRLNPDDQKEGLVYAQQVLTSVLQLTGPILDELLTGKAEQTALSLLLPTDANKISARLFYEVTIANANKTLRFLLAQHWTALKGTFENTSGGAPLPALRILEVGAGTGSGSVHLLESLEEVGIPFEYVYTDISSSFFPAAKEKFAKYGEKIKFKNLNLEEDPTSQGFAPGYFDVVFAVQVVHATRDVKETLCNLRKLMVDGGNLWMIESLDKNWFLDCTFGLLDGFWRFIDFELRPRHCMLSAEKWQSVLNEKGFEAVQDLQGDYFGVIVSRADCFGAEKSSSKELQKKLCAPHAQELHEHNHPKWVILYEKGESDYVTTLKNYFEMIGRKRIVLVKALKETSKFVNYSEVGQAISKELEDPTEGIIVTWGLSQQPPKQFQDELAKPYLDFLQVLIKSPENKTKQQLPAVFLLTKGQFPSGDIVCPNPAPSTLIGMTCAAVNEHKDLKLRILDLDPERASMWKAFQEMFGGLHDQNQAHPVTLFRGGSKFSPRFNTVKAPISSLELPSGSARFQLVPSQTIQDFKFATLPGFSRLKENEVEVRVVCSGVNSLDFLKPTNIHKVGSDYSGVITQVGTNVKKWKPGDAVFGISNHPLKSHVKDQEDQVELMPDKFTFAEAASIPIVFSTAHFALLELAKAQKDDVLLIHSTSDGVGLAAIQIAKELGLRIICTAGSERKRAYLRSLGIEHVFHSRTTEFSKQVLEVTGGKGVDIVLNFLTGAGFKEATVAACADGARFIEMSRLNIFTVEEMAQLRPDIKYSILDPFQLYERLNEKKYISVVAQWANEGKFRPIPYTRFDVGDVRDALTYLEKAKHIGQVVVCMPEVNKLTGTRKIPLFNDRSTYLITGGLGGIGLEVCKYMVEEGARNLAVVGRSPPSKATSEVLENLRKLHNCKILAFQGDVGSWEDCQRIFQSISEDLVCPLRGVMHSAGTLSDGMFENLNWEHFQKTFRSKVEGSWNLHELTKQLNLEHFVLFSSIASKLIPVGQTTHISACTFEDTLAHFRNSHGLPATTINWGQWAEVGVAKDLDHKVVVPFSRRQGIQSLDKILRKNQTSATVTSFKKVSVGVLEHYSFMKRIYDKKLLQQFLIQSGSHSGGNKINTVAFWEEYKGKDKEEGMSSKDKLQVCKKYLELMLRNILNLDQNDLINEGMDLSVMGMDSLMMIELVNLIQTTVGKTLKIPQGMLKDCRSLKDVASRFMEVIEERWTETKAPTLEQVREQSLIDVKLPDDIQVERPGSHVAPSQIKTLLLTGATGFVGSHLLKELIESYPQVEKIYCLVRGKEPEKRLFSVLEKNQIDLPVQQFLERVQILPGDFTQANFGLPEEKYLKISEEVDGIFHFGARVNHAEYYKKVPGGSGDVRSVNVGGLLNILQFSCKGKTKHVFYNSTLLTTAWLTGDDGRLQETWPTIERLTSCGTSMGYTISKMICELHLKQAVEERGIPVKVFQSCTFRGSTTSGKSFAEGTHLMRMILFNLKEGMVLNEKGPINVIPVDVAVKIITAVSFHDETPNEVFILSNPSPLFTTNCLSQLAQHFNLKMSILDSEEGHRRFLEKFNQAKDAFDKEGTAEVLRKALVYDLLLMHQDKNISNFVRTYGEEAWEGGWKDCRDFWISKKLQKFVPQLYSQIESPLEILKRDVKAAIEEGLLE